MESAGYQIKAASSVRKSRSQARRRNKAVSYTTIHRDTCNGSKLHPNVQSERSISIYSLL